MFPTSLSSISLSKWIGYTVSLKPLDDHLNAANALPDGRRKDILLTRNMVDRAYHTYQFFGGTDTPLVDDIVSAYRDGFCKLFENVEASEMIMPSSELAGTHPMTFGQFIDAKMLVQGAAGEDGNRWAVLQYLAAIFLCEDEYRPEYINEGNNVFIQMGELPMNAVVALAAWWESLNDYINNNYTLFQDSGEVEKANIKQHMERWGWINFLKSIAKTKVFDIAGSGMNSIDCARAAKAVDVLTWASEEKDYNIAVSRDMKETE